MCREIGSIPSSIDGCPVNFPECDVFLHNRLVNPTSTVVTVWAQPLGCAAPRHVPGSFQKQLPKGAQRRLTLFCHQKKKEPQSVEH
jgi:hypothetical protein